MKIGILFPGYPSQFVGMGKELYDNSRTIQEYFEEASNCLDMNFVKLCFASSDAEITKPSNALAALFLSGISVAHMIQEACPDLLVSGLAGHGVGEYSALFTANAITMPDGLYLLNKFAQFYEGIDESEITRTVIIKGLADRKVKQLCQEHEGVEISSYEIGRILVSGNSEALEEFADAAQDAGSAKVKTVDAINGYHTPVLQGLFDQLKIYLTKVDFNDPEIPVISGVTGKPVHKAQKAEASVMNQIVKPLMWKNVLKQFADYDMLLVPSPSKQLVKELSVLYPNKIIMGIESMADVELVRALIANGAAEPVLQMV